MVGPRFELVVNLRRRIGSHLLKIIGFAPCSISWDDF